MTAELVEKAPQGVETATTHDTRHTENRSQSVIGGTHDSENLTHNTNH
jgi:hypothetical protein